MGNLDISTEVLSPIIQQGLDLKGKADIIVVETSQDLMVANQLLKDIQIVEKTIEEKRVEMKKPFLEMERQIDTMAKQASFPVVEAKQTIKSKIVKYNEIQEQKRIEAERIERERLEALRKQEEQERLEKERIEREKREAEEKRLAEERAKVEEARKKAEAEADETKKKLAEMELKQKEEQAKINEEKMKLEQAQRELQAEKDRIEAEKKAEADRKAVEEQKAKELENIAEVKGIRKTWDFEVINADQVDRTFCSPDEKKIRQAVKNGVRIITGVRIFEKIDVR